ncbi:MULTISPECIES: acyl-CoA dehydrogenase family protein [unclassified Pseudomonas]|uniref:acyl-CoA dehydrogenase family protein n=1 Tax=unclassified Pseudomonas TaxID=196821 RepID=UPI0008713A75|nr:MULTISPECIES: acyl-CoA dehydrogenase family protein [unclassified Pseudomonas]SCW99105.1 Acyl-CoA dehydrogenase, C-terminal domain [Pseudomonas sp. NFACC56-3]SFK87984.1 Acyl-CoA dehydrogenase, C-terminal domain [Pseudomonas sp. NFACC52]
MNQTDNVLSHSVTRLFEDLCTDEYLRRAEQGEWLASHWQAIEELGLPMALLSEEAGGFGMDPAESLRLLQLAGRFALPLPLAETMLANFRLGEAGFTVGSGVSVMALTHDAKPLQLSRQPGGWRLSGECPNVPWGRHAERIAVPCGQPDGLYLIELPQGAWRVEIGLNLAGAPDDRLIVNCTLPDAAVKPAPHGLDTYIADEAATRVLLISGALERVLEMTVQYASERSQFGKPIGKFQVIQQNLALLASHTCAAAAAADRAVRALVDGRSLIPIAMAKSRAGEAASVACGLAHQIHGAIGFTAEHRLHFFTKLLWTCRDQGASEAYWNRRIGQYLIQASADADDLWPILSSL